MAKAKAGTQTSIRFPSTKKRRKPRKSVKKIANRGLLRAKISKQEKAIKALKKEVAAIERKDKVLKKKLSKVRRVSKITKPRKRTVKK